MSKLLALVTCLGGLTATALADPAPMTPTPAPGTATDVPLPQPEPAEPGPGPIPIPPEPETTSTTIVQPTVVQPVLVRDDDALEGISAYAWREPRMQSGIGVGITVGGGVTGFTDRMMRDTVSSSVGGLWDARLSLGTHVPIGLDVSYIGSAANVNTLTGTPNGTLVGTTAEAALRWNILPHETATPYVFAGAGWQRYDLTSVRLAAADSGMQQSDNVLEIPMGAGLAVRGDSGFTFDARGTFRAQATDSNLVLDQTTGSYAKLHTWEASANLGYEF